MKKVYLKPDVEYISFEMADIITDLIEGQPGYESGSFDDLE